MMYISIILLLLLCASFISLTSAEGKRIKRFKNEAELIEYKENKVLLHRQRQLSEKLWDMYLDNEASRFYSKLTMHDIKLIMFYYHVIDTTLISTVTTKFKNIQTPLQVIRHRLGLLYNYTQRLKIVRVDKTDIMYDINESINKKLNIMNENILKLKQKIIPDDFNQNSVEFFPNTDDHIARYDAEIEANRNEIEGYKQSKECKKSKTDCFSELIYKKYELVIKLRSIMYELSLLFLPDDERIIRQNELLKSKYESELRNYNAKIHLV